MGTRGYSGRRAAHVGRTSIPVVMACVLALVPVLAGCTSSTQGEAGSGSPGHATVPGHSSTAGGHAQAQSGRAVMTDVDLGLPFSVAVAAAARPSATMRAEVIESRDDAPQAQLTRRWSLGGDFSTIASFPIDAQRVFGSATSTPQDISSYGAAVLTQGGVQMLTSAPGPRSGQTYVEPQDGSARGDWVVWRSSTLNDSTLTASGVDNWSLTSANLSDGSVHELADARSLNGVDTTPATKEWTVPTSNDTDAYVSTFVGGDGAWRQVVLRVPLDGSGHPIEVAEGGAPAALDDGVLMAIPTEGTTGELTQVVAFARDGGEEDPLFSIVPGTPSWRVDGLWASGTHRVVAVVSDADPAEGAYLGLWEEGQASRVPLTWIHLASPTVVASLNATHIAWGSGSQQAPAQMYVMRWGSGDVRALGEAPGYSRPALAPSSPVVLVPRVSDTEVHWDVDQLE